jgi:diaminopimelate epimerase
MHGARNDFIIVDARGGSPFDLMAFARWACDRRAGIGADGVIVLEPAATADIRMRVINADGSEAEMCGNGIRCASRWLDEAGEGERVAFETGAGVVRTEIVAREPEYLVRVAMGRPRVTQSEPALSPSTPLRVNSVEGNGDTEPAAYVDLGNPHLVIFKTNVDNCDLERLAGGFQSDPAFPNGTNLHIVSPINNRAIRVRHWERGVGLTQACGTGAVASAAVAIERGNAMSPVEVFVPGGRLVVEWDGQGEAYLTGPAVRVFDTEICVGTGSLR